MTVLYVFPHPDDESFGPAPAMHRQMRQGHDVYLLTLTKGGATKQRHRLGLSVEAMGEVRHKEMEAVAEVLGLAGMTVLDLPDSGLKEIDPRLIEAVVRDEITRVRPSVIVTYPVHGISGFHDHLVTHAVVKRVFLTMKDDAPYLKRLAFHTLTEAHVRETPIARLHASTSEEIDCVETVDDIDLEKARAALDCYETYRETIEKSGVKDLMDQEVAYEFFQEAFEEPVDDLFAGLTAANA
jgi:LmbE family N-acetylglucosaminyl deacetylase